MVVLVLLIFRVDCVASRPFWEYPHRHSQRYFSFPFLPPLLMYARSLVILHFHRWCHLKKNILMLHHPYRSFLRTAFVIWVFNFLFTHFCSRLYFLFSAYVAFCFLFLISCRTNIGHWFQSFTAINIYAPFWAVILHWHHIVYQEHCMKE